jgi:hypothetical protein
MQSHAAMTYHPYIISAGHVCLHICKGMWWVPTQPRERGRTTYRVNHLVEVPSCSCGCLTCMGTSRCQIITCHSITLMGDHEAGAEQLAWDVFQQTGALVVCASPAALICSFAVSGSVPWLPKPRPCATRSTIVSCCRGNTTEHVQTKTAHELIALCVTMQITTTLMASYWTPRCSYELYAGPPSQTWRREPPMLRQVSEVLNQPASTHALAPCSQTARCRCAVLYALGVRDAFMLSFLRRQPAQPCPVSVPLIDSVARSTAGTYAVDGETGVL